jgi:uncharacterized protein YecE (DUF72 family)
VPKWYNVAAPRNHFEGGRTVAASILVGSCSWTDPTLISSGRFYPAGAKSPEARLRYYAEQFAIVEVDSTYYAPPSVRNSELWAARTPSDFVFNVKAFAWLTRHAAAPERLPDWLRDRLPEEVRGRRSVYARDVPEREIDLVWELHREALAPLAQAGKLGAVLFQFPPWFVRSRDNCDYLRSLPTRLPGWPLAVEFRGGGWMDDEAAATLRLLEEVGLTYVAVDEPQGFPNSTPPLTAVTAPLAMLRLHGRSADTWESRTGAASDRFKYLYDDAELEEWAPRVREMAEQSSAVHVLFNNNYEDWGMRNARRMARLLGVERQPPQPQLELG